MNADPATFDVVLASAVGMNLNHQVRAIMIMTFGISTCIELMSTTEEDMHALLVTIERPHNQNTQQQPVRINMSMR